MYPGFGGCGTVEKKLRPSDEKPSSANFALTEFSEVGGY
jgi:hypothetical protein